MKKYFPIVILLGCTAIFLWGIVQLFELRFEGGDVYPAYSSLRADPLGTMAFYESLGKVPGFSVSRDVSDTDQLPSEPNTVYLHLAASPYEWDEVPDDLFHEIKNFLANGGRLVIAFFPQTENPARSLNDNDDEATNSVGPVDGGKTMRHVPVKKKKHLSEDEEPMTSLADAWGFHQSFEGLYQDGDTYDPVSVMNKSGLPLPPVLLWHSGLIFTNCDSAWHTIYARGKDAVVIERYFDKGSVVMASDSYFLSNEAMAGDRHPEFLAWVVGSGRNVVFDEAHLGIVQTPGVAGLMRKYRLHGLAAALLLLAGLFIWKNSLSLVPPQADEKREDFVEGKDSTAGFVNLLRRSIEPRELLGTCLAEWKKSFVSGAKASTGRIQQAEAILSAENSRPPRERNSPAAYRDISGVLGRQLKKL